MPVRQKQKQSQNVKVIVNLAEQKRKRRRAKRRVTKIVQEQSRIQPSINVSSYYHPQQQAPTIPRYINPIHAPITEASIQELRRVFLENIGQQTPSAETPNIPQAPTPIETPEATPTSSVEEPIVAPEEAPMETPMETSMDASMEASMEAEKLKRVRRTKTEKTEAIDMGLEDPNPLHRKKAERKRTEDAIRKIREQTRQSPLSFRKDNAFRKDKEKDI
jgi:hypothetical protein